MESQKLIDSVKFLLKSVQQLSDRFVEANQGISNTLDKVFADSKEVSNRLQDIEVEVSEIRDQQLMGGDRSFRASPQLPVTDEQRERLFPSLNLPIESVLDVYRNTPALLEPFARPCSVSGKTLSGEIKEIELEVFAQGTTWIIELQNGDWVLVPRPGMLQRQTQLDGLSRIFSIQDEGALPAEVDLLSLSTATVIEHGRRWYLKDKGQIGVHPNPLEQSLELRLRQIEAKLDLMKKSSEGNQND